jgi:hypothetical protein
VKRVVGKIAANFAGHLLDALFEPGVRNEDVNGFPGTVTGFFLDGAFSFLGQSRLLLWL